MLFYTQTRRCIAWMVLAALLFASLSPSLASAFALTSASTSASRFSSASVKGPLGELCIARSGDSSRLPAIADQTDQTEQTEHGPVKHIHPLAHCILCSLHTDAIDFPHLPEAPSLPSLVRAGKPSLFYATPQPLHIWASPQSRAPPSA
jgi:hypothetical protein